MNKNSVFMEQIVCKYHPEFVKSEDLRRYGIKHADIFNIERLIEESLAAVGGYNFVDEAGRDFDCPDNSDSKTATVVINCNQTLRKVLIIGSVENKIGSLRVTIFNPFSNKIDFMYIPKKWVQSLMENSGTSGRANKTKQRIRASWSEGWRDNYNRLERFRLKSFEELAKAKDPVDKPFNSVIMYNNVNTDRSINDATDTPSLRSEHEAQLDVGLLCHSPS